MRRASSASMRPNWPLPSTPMVAPGSTMRFTEACPAGPSRSGRRETARSCSRRSGRLSGENATASSPALVAPALPIASVPTGTPPGICTIDSSESRPCSAALCTGTPSTGSTVCEATMPGRWAAPPAPAMITWMPRASAFCANSAIHTGVRCAETTSFSYGMLKRSSTSAAWDIVSQSDVEPMMTATSGLSGTMENAEYI